MPPVPLKDVLLVGFGAVGAVYSYILKKSGLARVTAVARSNYDIVNSHGVTFHSKKYGDITGWKPDRLVKSVAEATDQSYSYVFVTTKAIPEVMKTSDILKPLFSTPYSDRYPQPTYVLVQNGLNVERDLHDALLKLGKGRPSIIGTALYIGTNLLAPNVVEHNHFDRLSLGIYRHQDYITAKNTPAEAELLQDIGNILKTGGTTVTIAPEIQRIKFKKNFWNVAFSSVSTLTGYRLPALWRPPPSDPSLSYEPYVSPATAELIEKYAVPSVKATLDELVTLGHAMGFPNSEDGVPSSYSEEAMASTKALHVDPLSTHTPSMLLDAQKGQPIEVEVIFGEVVRLAREFNVAVPRIETLYGQLLVVQNQILRKIESGRSSQ
ncbi:6-phosphogluconate dehydrogenase C-terminal domain-like protein [Macrolepiota fuliginosa MF-IS2]|uniref:6-phosphogluconate dehydrogenase C-terminal domain-like protein n=1 Tax=Macrolepiota fuliginosa MF-IS2 TaxID=1400762 RepID=A0A9P5X543_9AGAR|nr:6-phosphogluconate dehydrogenase C-terminal domain-like protein [Macrolepiota fuliginosa MF-IS2]